MPRPAGNAYRLLPYGLTRKAASSLDGACGIRVFVASISRIPLHFIEELEAEFILDSTALYRGYLLNKPWGVNGLKPSRSHCRDSGYVTFGV
jgi:hypothetical protein